MLIIKSAEMAMKTRSEEYVGTRVMSEALRMWRYASRYYLVVPLELGSAEAQWSPVDHAELGVAAAR